MIKTKFYRVVWVKNKFSDIVEDIWEDNIESLSRALYSQNLAKNNGEPEWYPRIQKVKYSFIKERK